MAEGEEEEETWLEVIRGDRPEESIVKGTNQSAETAGLYQDGADVDYKNHLITVQTPGNGNYPNTVSRTFVHLLWPKTFEEHKEKLWIRS